MRSVRWNSTSSTAPAWTLRNENRNPCFVSSIMATSIACALPVPVPHFAHEAQDGVVGHVLQFPDQLREHLRALADDLLQLGRDFSGQGEQDVGIFVQFPGQGDDRLLAGRGLFAALDLAEVRRLDADAGSDAADGKLRVGLPQRLAAAPDVITEVLGHVCSRYYTVLSLVKKKIPCPQKRGIPAGADAVRFVRLAYPNRLQLQSRTIQQGKDTFMSNASVVIRGVAVFFLGVAI